MLFPSLFPSSLLSSAYAGDVLVHVIALYRLGILVLDGLVEGEGRGLVAELLTRDPCLEQVLGREHVVALAGGLAVGGHGFSEPVKPDQRVPLAGQGACGQYLVLALVCLEVLQGFLVVPEPELAYASIEFGGLGSRPLVLIDDLRKPVDVSVAVERELELTVGERGLGRVHLRGGFGLFGLGNELAERQNGGYHDQHDRHSTPYCAPVPVVECLEPVYPLGELLLPPYLFFMRLLCHKSYLLYCFAYV